MKKLLSLIIILSLLLIPVAAYAVELPGITVTAVPVDYVSALAGIAQPVTKSYAANERFAVWVAIDIPDYVSDDSLTIEITKKNCTVDAQTLALASGDYIIYGTVLYPGASVKVTIKDNLPAQAATLEQLQYALYADRTVSATATLGVTSPGTVTTIPKTGGPVSIVGALLCMMGAVVFDRRRRV